MPQIVLELGDGGIDSAKHSCPDTETPINEIPAPYYTDDVTSATVV